MSSSSTVSSARLAVGSGFAFLSTFATAVLFVLQVGGFINVSWWLVFAPMLVSFGLGIGTVIVLLGVVMILALLGSRR